MPPKSVIEFVNDRVTSLASQLTQLQLQVAGLSPGAVSPPSTPGQAGPNFADAEVPMGVIDSANTKFILQYFPSPGASLLLFLKAPAGAGGEVQYPGTDFTLQGSLIQFTTPPATGSHIVAWYRYTVVYGWEQPFSQPVRARQPLNTSVGIFAPLQPTVFMVTGWDQPTNQPVLRLQRQNVATGVTAPVNPATSLIYGWENTATEQRRQSRSDMPPATTMPLQY